MPTVVQCRSWAEAEVHVAALQARLDEVERRVRHVEKVLDTLGSAWWKRLWWRLDGFAPWYVVEPRRRWRPWHRRAG